MFLFSKPTLYYIPSNIWIRKLLVPTPKFLSFYIKFIDFHHAQNLRNEAFTEKNGVDFLRLCEKWRDIASLPGWNGNLE